MVEVIYNLDVLCSMDKSLVPKLIEIIRRLYARVTSDFNRWKRVLIPVVQFLLNHGELDRHLSVWLRGEERSVV